jgi:hypothetical protein
MTFEEPGRFQISKFLAVNLSAEDPKSCGSAYPTGSSCLSVWSRTKQAVFAFFVL